MQKKAACVGLLVRGGMLFAVSLAAWAQSDVIQTSKGDLRITPIHHASLMLQFDGKVIYVDPVSQGGDYSGKPKADLILLTHEHGDHMSRAKIDDLETGNTVIFAPECVTLARIIPEAEATYYGEKKIFSGIEIEAVAAYNLTRGPREGKLFHPKNIRDNDGYACDDMGRGNGYVLTLGDKRLYISGDTECIPEIKALRNIDVAFVSMSPPYTMTPGEAAECVNAFKPKIVYPYHFRETNLQEFTRAVRGTPGVEVRLRKWY